MPDALTQPAATAPPRPPDSADLRRRYRAAKARQTPWQGLWQQCYDYALPQRDSLSGATIPADRQTDRLFDATAPDAVDQLAASLLSQLTPPWSRWFALAPGRDLTASEHDRLSPVLEDATQTLLAHLDRSNFALEMHQAFLDLVTVGTACLHIDEAPPGGLSAFSFAAVPVGQLVLEENRAGQLDGIFRQTELTLAGLRGRFPTAALPRHMAEEGSRNPDQRFTVVEAVVPDGPAFRYSVFRDDGAADILLDRRLPHAPFIAFRWMKSPGEIYGRSPVMKALPDIKTANKVVELVLKNASIAVTGIWQADDDGVLNPATIRLAPGAIIPKAVGSAGLKPLDMPGRFDVSQLVLADLRGRIRHALLVDRLAQIDGRDMTATEVLERSGEMARLLGATYGRLQAELLAPLIERLIRIARRRGDIPDLSADGRIVQIDFRSPLARAQAQRDVQETLSWIRTALGLGPEALQALDIAAATRWLGRALGVPAELIRDAVPEAGGSPSPTDPPTQQES